MLNQLLNEMLLPVLIENKSIILLGAASIAYSYIEYRLGEGEHGSFIGFLKYYMKKKNEPKT